MATRQNRSNKEYKGFDKSPKLYSISELSQFNYYAE